MTADVNVVIDHSEYTILVVDDVVSNVLLLKVLLTNEKFKVVTANNGKDALVHPIRWTLKPGTSPSTACLPM